MARCFYLGLDIVWEDPFTKMIVDKNGQYLFPFMKEYFPW